MKDKRNLLLLSLLLACSCSAPAGQSQGTAPDSSGDSSAEESSKVYVLPTKRGEKYLKKNVLNPRVNVRKASEGTAYTMIIDQSAIEDIGAKFHEDGNSAYQPNDIDVLLFGIGTNFDNSPDADTLLYASLDEEGVSSESSEEAPSRSLITGVSYEYGTGPLKYQTEDEQLVWLKTTVMEFDSSLETYVTDEDTPITYTPVYVQFKDTVAPEVGDVKCQVSFSNYLAFMNGADVVGELTLTLEEWCGVIVGESIVDTSAAIINTEEHPFVRSLEITDKKESYAAGDKIEGTFTAGDGSKNVSETKTFSIELGKDYNNDSIIEIPYRDLTTGKDSKKESKLKTAILDTFKSSDWYYWWILGTDIVGREYRNAVTVDDITLLNYDEEKIAEISNIKENVLEKREIKISAKVGDYGDIDFRIVLKDTYPVKKVVNPDFNRVFLSTLDAYVAAYAKSIDEIDDDFEDTYYLLVRLTDFGSGDIGVSVYIVDSSENRLCCLATQASEGYVIYNDLLSLLDGETNLTRKYDLDGNLLE